MQHYTSQYIRHKKNRYELAYHPCRIDYSRRAPGGDRLAVAIAGRSAVDSRLHPRAARQGRVLSSLRTAGGGRFPALDSGGKRNRQNLRVFFRFGYRWMSRVIRDKVGRWIRPRK
jgi:hypothetical protein